LQAVAGALLLHQRERDHLAHIRDLVMQLSQLRIFPAVLQRESPEKTKHQRGQAQGELQSRPGAPPLPKGSPKCTEQGWLGRRQAGFQETLLIGLEPFVESGTQAWIRIEGGDLSEAAPDGA